MIKFGLIKARHDVKIFGESDILGNNVVSVAFSKNKTYKLKMNGFRFVAVDDQDTSTVLTVHGFNDERFAEMFEFVGYLDEEEKVIPDSKVKINIAVAEGSGSIVAWHVMDDGSIQIGLIFRQDLQHLVADKEIAKLATNPNKVIEAIVDLDLWEQCVIYSPFLD